VLAVAICIQGARVTRGDGALGWILISIPFMAVSVLFGSVAAVADLWCMASGRDRSRGTVLFLAIELLAIAAIVAAFFTPLVRRAS
jgi:hypothetical protein